MFKSCLAGLALALALGGAQAEVTARHAYVSFDTVAAAQKNARADELVYFRGHITAEPEDGVYVFEDGTGQRARRDSERGPHGRHSEKGRPLRGFRQGPAPAL